MLSLSEASSCAITGKAVSAASDKAVSAARGKAVRTEKAREAMAVSIRSMRKARQSHVPSFLQCIKHGHRAMAIPKTPGAMRDKLQSDAVQPKITQPDGSRAKTVRQSNAPAKSGHHGRNVSS
ncbi:hypothetical protein GCM10022290_41790 [Sagittula marina]